MRNWRIYILLIVSIVVLGVTSISYAYSVSDFNTNLQSIVNNAPSSQNNMKSAINVMLNNNANYNNNINNIGMENYNYVLASYVIYNSARSYFDIIMTNDNLDINIDNTYITFNTIPTNFVVYRFAIVKFGGEFGGVSYEGNVTNSFTISNTTFRRMPTDNYTRNLLVFNVTSLNNPNNLEYLGNWSPPLLFYIDLNTNSNTQYFSINTDTGNTLTNIPVLSSFNFGTLFDSTYIYYIHDLLGFWYWTGNSWTYKVIYNRNKDMVLLQNNNYMSFNYSNDNEESDLYINDIVQYKNVIYHFQITNAQFDSIDSYFLVGDVNTIITNDTIDTSNFGSDYLNQFKDLDNIINNNDNTTDIINSITNIDNIDNTIDNFLSGDVNSWGADIGYSPLANPFTTFLLDLVTNVYNSLTQRGNVTLDFNHHGTTSWIINTSDFVTPESDIKNLVKWSLVFLWIYGNYKYFHYLITLIETARIDKAIADLGTDEFYDSDIM